MQEKFEIVIVGGGTSGWLSAGFLLSQLPNNINRPLQITLVEASDIPTIGVGEATIPSLRETLAACGIEEHVFMNKCSATFKHGIQFNNWVYAPEDNPNDSYFHPFGDPLSVAGHNPARQWTQLPLNTRDKFSDLFSVQPELAHGGQAPKHLRDKPYDGPLAYAYHLDAGLLAEFLKTKFKSLGVRHIIDKVAEVARDGDTITGLKMESGQSLNADLYLDCTGFAARLINSDKANKFNSKTPYLFVDKAVTARVPHGGISDINGFTNSTAKQSGWVWDIVLKNRRGVGHVYSSKYTDDETAKAVLAEHIGMPQDELEIRELSMRIGYHQQQWRGNCVAIGLASGFLEPLESTGIYLVEMANWALAEFIPRYIAGAKPQAHYDAVMHNHYENITDFLKLHYCLTRRDDSAFWRDNRKPDTIPKTLQKHLENWHETVPGIYDFDKSIQCFSATNYQFVLYGMGWPGHDMKGHGEVGRDMDGAKAMMHELALRRDRHKQFVLRDTVDNRTFYTALDGLTV